MAKLGTMASLIIDAERKPQTPVKLRPPPGSRLYTSLSRSRSVTVGSSSGHPISRSKAAKLVVDSLQRRNPPPDSGSVVRKNRSVRSKGKKSSKLRSIVSFVFAGHRRRRSSSLSPMSTLSTSSSRSSKVKSSIRRRDSSPEEKTGGKYSSLSLSSSSTSSTASIGKKKKERGDGGGGRGIIVNSGNCRGGRLSRGNSLRGNGKKEKGKEEEKKEERYELCKLRILMGGKCKPLNCSGKLRYDEEGVLVPDPLPPSTTNC